MTPDDSRHGTYAGFQAHVREDSDPCDRCVEGRYLAKKRVTLEHARGERMFYTRDELLEVMQPWLDMGIRPSAISAAAGFRGQKGSEIAALVRGTRTVVRRSTYHAFATVTEDSLRPNSKVHSDLTRQRVQSLMAIGHMLIDMPILATGQWRTREYVTVGNARAIRDYYQAHENIQGPNAHTAARARGTGYRVPAAWDDPGTLAWPMRLSEIEMPAGDDLDEVVVIRLLAGDTTITATKAEKIEAMRRWLLWGRSEASFCEIHGWKDGRYVIRDAEAVA